MGGGSLVSCLVLFSDEMSFVCMYSDQSYFLLVLTSIVDPCCLENV